MTFFELVTSFIGADVKIVTSSDIVNGVLISVNHSSLLVVIQALANESLEGIVLVPMRSIEYVCKFSD